MRIWPNSTGEKLRTIVSRSRITAIACAFVNVDNWSTAAPPSAVEPYPAPDIRSCGPVRYASGPLWHLVRQIICHRTFCHVSLEEVDSPRARKRRRPQSVPEARSAPQVHRGQARRARKKAELTRGASARLQQAPPRRGACRGKKAYRISAEPEVLRRAENYSKKERDRAAQRGLHHPNRLGALRSPLSQIFSKRSTKLLERASAARRWRRRRRNP